MDAVYACCIFSRYGRFPSEFLSLGENERAFVMAAMDIAEERRGKI